MNEVGSGTCLRQRRGSPAPLGRSYRKRLPLDVGWGGGEVRWSGAGWIGLARLGWSAGFGDFVVERRADPNLNPRVVAAYEEASGWWKLQFCVMRSTMPIFALKQWAEEE